MFRHEGIFVSALLFGAGLIFLRLRRYGSRLVLAGWVVVVLTKFALPVVFQADARVTRWAYSLPFVRDSGGVVQAGGNLDDGDKQFLEKIAPLPYLRAHFSPGFPE